jgi:hypothetical protein
VPSVKSLLVRARVSLAEAAEARLLTCDEVRLELGHVAEGIARSSAPVRRHLKGCERCRVFKGELRKANKALAAVYPLGPLVLVKKFVGAKLSFGAGATGASTAGGSSSGAGFASGAAAAASSAAGGAGASGVLSAGLGTVASKAVAGFAAAAIVAAGAVEAKHVVDPQTTKRPAVAAVSAPPVPVVAAPAPFHAIAHSHELAAVANVKAKPAVVSAKAAATKPTTQPAAATTPATAPAPAAATSTTPSAQQQQQPAPGSNGTQHPSSQPTTQEGSSTVVLDGGSGDNGSGSASGSGGDGSAQGSGPGQSSPPGESPSAPPQPQPAPVVGERDPTSQLGAVP